MTLGAPRKYDRAAIATDLQSGMTRPEVASKHGCSTAFVSLVVKWYGLQGRLPRSTGRDYSHTSHEITSWLRAIAWWQSGKTDSEVADLLGVSRQRVGQMRSAAHNKSVSTAMRDDEILRVAMQAADELRDIAEMWVESLCKLKKRASAKYLGGGYGDKEPETALDATDAEKEPA